MKLDGAGGGVEHQQAARIAFDGALHDGDKCNGGLWRNGRLGGRLARRGAESRGSLHVAGLGRGMTPCPSAKDRRGIEGTLGSQ